MPSIFSRIVAGEIPAVKLYEDAQTFAFMDIGPASRGHSLVIPKDEHADLFDTPAETFAAVMLSAQRVAKALKAALGCDGLNLIQNNGAAAGQTVFHLHVHLIPRWEGDGAVKLWSPGQASAAELEALATQVRAALAV
jgi:histidine triad (HIT) family protein